MNRQCSFRFTNKFQWPSNFGSLAKEFYVKNIPESMESMWQIVFFSVSCPDWRALNKFQWKKSPIHGIWFAWWNEIKRANIFAVNNTNVWNEFLIHEFTKVKEKKIPAAMTLLNAGANNLLLQYSIILQIARRTLNKIDNSELQFTHLTTRFAATHCCLPNTNCSAVKTQKPPTNYFTTPQQFTSR